MDELNENELHAGRVWKVESGTFAADAMRKIRDSFINGLLMN